MQTACLAWSRLDPRERQFKSRRHASFEGETVVGGTKLPTTLAGLWPEERRLLALNPDNGNIVWSNATAASKICAPPGEDIMMRLI
jgi:outer membrane protein assembly factor BamB